MGRRFAAIGMGVVCAAVLGTGVASASSWVIQSTPNPTDSRGSVLRGVSCPSTTACTAVGGYTNSARGAVTLAARWNGSGWALESTPNPTGASLIVLRAISCPSSTACTAVGEYFNSAGTRVTLAERWNGSSWAIQSTPNPTGSQDSVLYGVSCPSTTACIAVGSNDLAERWNGSSWAIQSTHIPAAARIARMKVRPLAIGVQRARVLRINQPRILLAHQFLHHREHVDLALVGKHFRVLLVWLAYAHIPEMHVVDRVPRPEIAADFHRVLAHLAGDPTIEGDAIRRAGHDADEPLPTFHSPHYLPRAAAERRRRIVGMQRQPHARFGGHRHHGLQEICDVAPHLF